VKIILTPRRHAVALKPGERHPTPEEKSAMIAEGRRAMAAGLMRMFPQATILGIQGKGEILVELPDDDPGLKDRIRAELDVETGPAPGEGPPMPVWREDLQPTLETVQAMYRALDYRPTVLAVVRDDAGRVLLVQSIRNFEWGFVQGGIEASESPSVALFREIKEEIGVGARRVRRRPPRFIGCADIDAESGAADHLKFTKGVRYFVYDVAYHGPERLSLQSTELSAHAWVEPRFDDARLLACLAGARPQKSRLIIAALIKVL